MTLQVVLKERREMGGESRKYGNLLSGPESMTARLWAVFWLPSAEAIAVVQLPPEIFHT